MKWICDQKYLKEAQYRSAKNLEARIQLHRRFGLDQTPWTEWLMAKIPLVDGAWVLDIGCGPGTLWRDQLSRLPAGHFILADLSIGMVNTALQDLRDDQRFSYLQADAQEIPVKPGIMDVVLANHMLYHVPEIRQSLSELRRVLKPGGWLCASTNGKGHLVTCMR